MSMRKLVVRIVIVLVGVQIAAYVGSLLLRARYRAQNYGECSVNAVAIFSGAEEHIDSQAFTGGAVRAICGGVDIDLTAATIAEAPAILEVTVICGGVMVRTPSDWKVALTPSVTMGGVDDIREQTQASDDSSPNLIVTGKVVCGGLAIGDAETAVHEHVEVE